MTYHTFQLLWLAVWVIVVIVYGVLTFTYFRHIEWEKVDSLHKRCVGCGKVRHIVAKEKP